jgi:hypothetical protein
MKSQAALLGMKQAVLSPESNLWRHAAVRPLADHEVPLLEHQVPRPVGRDFSRVPVHASGPDGGHAEVSCPLTPRRCPFGGACHTCPTAIQTKPAISRPGDEYEQEADRTAEMVMRRPETPRSGSRSNTNWNGTPLVPPIVRCVLESAGRPLEPSSREFFEKRFGKDLSQVRVHTDGKATESARAVEAQAYAVGWNIVFDQSRYAPDTVTGSLLLAHELTHVIQQRGDSGPFLAEPRIGKRDDPAEQEANQILRNLFIHDGLALDVHPRPVSLQRAEEGLCLPLSDLFRLLSIPGFDKINQAVSMAAEVRITQNYCKKMGCKAMVTDYFDNPIAYSYVSFLLDHNPHLQADPKTQSAFLLDTLKGVKRPDILTHKSDRKEYYEIKPCSVNGINAGVEKLHEIQGFMEVYRLPYEMGVVYNPDPERLVSKTIKVGPAEVTASLRARRIAPGLIVYDFCFQGDVDWGKVLVFVLLAALVALIIVLTEGGAAPILVPVLASKTQSQQETTKPGVPVTKNELA